MCERVRRGVTVLTAVSLTVLMPPADRSGDALDLRSPSAAPTPGDGPASDVIVSAM